MLSSNWRLEVAVIQTKRADAGFKSFSWSLVCAGELCFYSSEFYWPSLVLRFQVDQIKLWSCNVQPNRNQRLFLALDEFCHSAAV